MAVTIHKQRDEVEQLTEDVAADIADRLGRLGEEVEDLERRQAQTKSGKRLTAVRRELAELSDGLLKEAEEDLPADGSWVGVGKEFRAEVSPRQNQTTITDKHALVEYLRSLGEDEFLSLVSFKLGELRDYLPGKMLRAVTMTERTGRRSLRVKRVE